MLHLPDVTLCMIETREHELARLAIRDCLDKVKFGDVLIFTDRPSDFSDQGRTHYVPDWPEKIGWCRHYWSGIAPYLQTPFVLGIQWDSWVVDTTMWRRDYLDYDYIGAPWWYKDGKNVGNGGFSLRSVQLVRYLRKHLDRYPCNNTLDDDLLCRTYRRPLQDDGFTWAPEQVARDFSFEIGRPDPLKTFGFHACFNFWYGCGRDQERLLERARIMVKSKYMTEKNTFYWRGFCKNNPGIEEALQAEGVPLPPCERPEHVKEFVDDVTNALCYINDRGDIRNAVAR